jgi:hypothetical protein
MASQRFRQVANTPFHSTKVVATTPTLALARIPTKLDLIERRAAKQDCAHGHVRASHPPVAFVEIVGRQRGVERPFAQPIEQPSYAIRREHHVVVEEHEPVSFPTAFALIARANDRRPPIRILLQRFADHTVNDQAHPPLRRNAPLNLWVKSGIIARENNEIDRWIV